MEENKVEVLVEANVSEQKEVQQEKVDESKISYFTGKLLDLMGWNYLRYLLTAVTASVGAPWGKCFYLKYKIGNIYLGNRKLKFKGDGSELFVEKFKWNFLTLVTFGIYRLWVPVKKANWFISHISFEDEKLDSNNSFFTGKVLKFLGINILCALITIVSFGLLFPVAECIKLRWLAKNTIISNKNIKFEGNILGLYGKYLKWIFLTIITLGIYGFWVGLRKIEWEVENTVLVD